MKTLRQQHANLNDKINAKYRELIEKLKTVSFYDDVEEDYDFSEYETVTLVNRSGDNVDAKVLGISSKNGIYIAKEENTDVRFWIELNDLSNLHDKITIVELLENYQL